MGVYGPEETEKVDNCRVESFLKKSLPLYVGRLIKEKALKFDDMDVDLATSDVGMKPPALDTKSFTQTCPNTSGYLPLRQDIIDLVSSKITLPALKMQLEELIRNHDKQRIRVVCRSKGASVLSPRSKVQTMTRQGLRRHTLRRTVARRVGIVGSETLH